MNKRLIKKYLYSNLKTHHRSRSQGAYTDVFTRERLRHSCTQYNTTSILRTIEQILGLPPMNIFDASATPMFDCFTDTPNLTPFTALPNNVPLDQLNPSPTALADPQLRADAERSATLNFEKVDRAPEDVLNRILWRAMKGAAVPYPEWAITPSPDDGDR